jgi:hypothetical protein
VSCTHTWEDYLRLDDAAEPTAQDPTLQEATSLDMRKSGASGMRKSGVVVSDTGEKSWPPSVDSDSAAHTIRRQHIITTADELDKLERAETTTVVEVIGPLEDEATWERALEAVAEARGGGGGGRGRFVLKLPVGYWAWRHPLQQVLLQRWASACPGGPDVGNTAAVQQVSR